MVDCSVVVVVGSTIAPSTPMPSVPLLSTIGKGLAIAGFPEYPGGGPVFALIIGVVVDTAPLLAAVPVVVGGVG
mgnify:FL=1